MHLKYFKIGIHEISAFFIVVFATLVRILLIGQGWPQINSDEGTMGLMALHIAYRGEHPAFFYGQGYMGSFEAYLAAGIFHLLGPSVFTLRLGMLIIFALFLISTYLLTSLLYSRKLALVTLLLLSMGSQTEILQQVRAIGGYPEMPLLGSLLLLLASWLAFSFDRNLSTRKRWLRYVAYACWGYLVGFGIWTDLLILPFVLMAGLLLVIFCWREMRILVVLSLLLGFVTGVFPLIAYNITAPPELSSLSYFLWLYRAGQTGQALSHIPLIQKMAGTILLGLPTATGSILPCTTSGMLILGYESPLTRQCTLIQGAWGLGYIILLGIAIFLAMRDLWILRHQSSAQPWSSRERQNIVRHFARLMLLASAGLTLLLFALSPASALVPALTARYLIGLLVATPAVIFPLWKSASTGNTHRHSETSHSGLLIGHLNARKYKPFKNELAQVMVVFRGCALLLIGIVLLIGTVNTFQAIAPTQAIARQQNALISDLLHIGATRIYSEYWTCDRIIFQTNERIICSAVDEQLAPGLDRYLPYRSIVTSDRHASYVFPLSSPQAVNFARKLPRLHKRYQHYVFDGYVVYQPT